MTVTYQQCFWENDKYEYQPTGIKSIDKDLMMKLIDKDFVSL